MSLADVRISPTLPKPELAASSPNESQKKSVRRLYILHAVVLHPSYKMSSSSSSSPPLISPPTEINNSHKVYSFAIACIVLGVVATLFVLLRLAQRLYARAFGPDDYVIIPGVVGILLSLCRKVQLLTR